MDKSKKSLYTNESPKHIDHSFLADKLISFLPHIASQKIKFPILETPSDTFRETIRLRHLYSHEPILISTKPILMKDVALPALISDNLLPKDK